ELKKRSKQTTANERSLWHGTSADAITSINNGGFNRSYCGKNATVYGQGVYFAVGSSYSAHNQYATPDANGMKHVYQALVLTGECTIGHSSYRVPPANPATPGFPFDTVVDNASTPGIFVIFLDNQAYPEYLITF
ncbi:Protein mono-ADP-ribosyltransferase PARP14, partial [Lamellibrachia satsuma]